MYNMMWNYFATSWKNQFKQKGSIWRQLCYQLFKDVYSVQIIEVFTGTGHNFNMVCPVNSKTRLDREDYWVEALQTSYHYGLDLKKGKLTPNLTVEYSFPSIPSSRQRSARSKSNANFDILKDMESIFNCIHNYITDNLKVHSILYAYFWTRLERNIFKKLLLKSY